MMIHISTSATPAPAVPAPPVPSFVLTSARPLPPYHHRLFYNRLRRLSGPRTSYLCCRVIRLVRNTPLATIESP